MFCIARAFHPCTDLAGDGVGAVVLPDGAIGVFLLDVSGHGVGAALLSFTLNHLLSPTVEASTLVESGTGGRRAAPPALVADRLNRQFPMDRSRQYFTLVYGILEPASNRFRYVTAGHPAPILLRPGQPPLMLASTGPPIGLLEQAAFEDALIVFKPGDRVYLYSDGVTEASDANDEEFGVTGLIAQIDRLRQLPLREGLESIVDAVRQWTGEALRDDVSLVAVERVDTQHAVNAIAGQA